MDEPVWIGLAPLEGGAIVSLLVDGKEWLVQGPPRPAPLDDSEPFTRHPPRGWDEMMPTIDACGVGKWKVPDHGEAWRRPWASDDGCLRFTSDWGYTLAREIVHESRGVRLRYTVTSNRQMPFLWSPHPLLRAPAGSRVELDSCASEVYEISAQGTVLRPFRPCDLDIDSLDLGDYRKVVFPPSSAISKARVTHPDGSWVELEWDLANVPYLAVYLERQAFTAEDCIAIEPMTGWYDDLSAAVARGLCSWVSPASPRQWDLHVSAGKA